MERGKPTIQPFTSTIEAARGMVGKIRTVGSGICDNGLCVVFTSSRGVQQLSTWLLGYSGMSKKVGPRARNGAVAPRGPLSDADREGKWESVPRRHFTALYSPNTSPRIWSACR